MAPDCQQEGGTDLALVVGTRVDEVGVGGVLAKGHEVHGALPKLYAPARPRDAPLRHCPQLHHPLQPASLQSQNPLRIP